MIDCGETLAGPDGSERRRRVVSYLILPAAALTLGATIALWPSAEATVATLRDDSLHCCGEANRYVVRAACGDRAAASRHPAKGANIPLAFHPGQDRTSGAVRRNSS